MKTEDFADYGLKVVKLTNSFHSNVGTQEGKRQFFKTADFGQTKDHLPRKGNPYIWTP